MAKAKPKEETKPKAPGTAVSAKLDGGAMILQGDKADLSHLKNSQRGSENVGVEDIAVPRLEIVQSVSPQLEKGNAEYIEGAKVGDLINSVTNQVYGKEVFVVNVFYTKQWLVWKDRKKGGGFFGAYPSPAEAEDRMKQEGGKEAGLEVLDTPTHMCLLVDTARGAVDEIILSMPRTKAKVSRQWNSMIRLTGQDRFARVYRVTTTLETNKRNEKYYNYVVSNCGTPAPQLYAHAEKLYNALAGGKRQVVMSTKGFDPGEPGETDPNSEM